MSLGSTRNIDRSSCQDFWYEVEILRARHRLTWPPKDHRSTRILRTMVSGISLSGASAKGSLWPWDSDALAIGLPARRHYLARHQTTTQCLPASDVSIYIYLLQELRVWLPSTFESCQTGPGATWFAPGSSSCSRIDYIAVPDDWAVADGSAFVVDSLDWGQPSVDHLQVAVFASYFEPTVNGLRTGPPKLDQSAMASPAGQAKIRAICARAPVFDWDLDANVHTDRLQSFLLDALQKEFPLRKRRRASSFFSDATWLAHGHRMWLRRRTASLREHTPRRPEGRFCCLAPGSRLPGGLLCLCCPTLGAGSSISGLRLGPARRPAAVHPSRQVGLASRPGQARRGHACSRCPPKTPPFAWTEQAPCTKWGGLAGCADEGWHHG